MEDLREIFREKWKKEKEVHVRKLIGSYVAEVIENADKESPASIKAVAGLIDTYANLRF